MDWRFGPTQFQILLLVHWMTKHFEGIYALPATAASFQKVILIIQKCCIWMERWLRKVLSELCWPALKFNSFEFPLLIQNFLYLCALFLASGLCCDLWLILITFPIAILNENYQQTSEFMHSFLFHFTESTLLCSGSQCASAQTMCSIMREEETDLNENKNQAPAKRWNRNE